jgi:transcriptional regulator with XRE-family HTH domain
MSEESGLTGSDEGVSSGASPNTMTAPQCRAARGLLGWSETELARRSGLDEGFVKGFEAGTGDPASGQVEALRSALMQGGIVFTNGATAGVRLSEQQRGGNEGTRVDQLTTENDR